MQQLKIAMKERIRGKEALLLWYFYDASRCTDKCDYAGVEAKHYAVWII